MHISNFFSATEPKSFLKPVPLPGHVATINMNLAAILKNIVLFYQTLVSCTQDSEIALLTERKDKEIQEALSEKHSEMLLALEDAQLQKTAASGQFDSQRVELEQKVADLEQVCTSC